MCIRDSIESFPAIVVDTVVDKVDSKGGCTFCPIAVSGRTFLPENILVHTMDDGVDVNEVHKLHIQYN